jgi:IS6 family transposase
MRLAPAGMGVGDRWFTGVTYVKVAGVWRYVYRAVDQHGQVIPDRAPALANVIEELIPAAFHNTGQYENNCCEAVHGRLKVRLRPMRELLTDWTASVVIRGHDNIWNLRRGHYELGVETAPVFRLARARGELQLAIRIVSPPSTSQHDPRSRNATVPAEMGHRY